MPSNAEKARAILQGMRDREQLATAIAAPFADPDRPGFGSFAEDAPDQHAALALPGRRDQADEDAT